MSNIEISRAASEDIPHLASLLNILFSQDIEFEPEYQKQLDGLSLIAGNPSIGSILVLKIDGNVCGMVSLLYSVSTVLGGRVAVLEDMVIAPEMRGAGYGSMLLEKGIEFARSEGCMRITLLTDFDNYRAMNFYAKQGFVKSKMIPMRLVF